MQNSWEMVPAGVFDSDIFTFYLVYLQEPERDNTKKRAKKGICKTGKGAGRRGGILSDQNRSLAGGIDSDTGSDRGKNRNRQCDGREAKLAGHRNFELDIAYIYSSCFYAVYPL